MRVLTPLVRPRSIRSNRPRLHRALLTLAIETSCDDTSVAILETKTCANQHYTSAALHFHKKVTSNNIEFQGVHPIVSLYSHQENLAVLLDEALSHLPRNQIPDFVSVTRGPGMRSNLFTGLDTAKGLAVAWQRPLVGVHHMQAHALTPRLVKALQNSQNFHPASMGTQQRVPSSKINIEPEFPFLSVLVSGGHTLLIHSASLTHHKILASTTDIALGECLDKIARSVLPPELLKTASTTMYGPLLEKFAFSETPLMDTNKAVAKPKIDERPAIRAQHVHGRLHQPVRTEYRLEDTTAKEYLSTHEKEYEYVIPKNNEKALNQNTTKWGWKLNQPLSKGAGGLKSKSMEMSFTGLLTCVERLVQFETDKVTGKTTKTQRSIEDISIEERRDMARESMRAAFEHLATRVVLALQQSPLERPASVGTVATVVMAGGVAANSYLKFILASMLCTSGFSDLKLVFPPASLCTDNAAMIAWTGTEMFQAGYSDPRTIRSIRKWPLDQLLAPIVD